MDKYKSKVYVKTDSSDRIIRIEGGYTTPSDLTGWVQIDEGEGDRYNLCQTHYFDGGLYTADGIPRYKLVDGQAVERTAEEIAADRLPSVRAAKETELSNACNAAIVSGLDMKLPGGTTEHFDYSERDQINMKEMFDAVLMGATMYPYQSEDGSCRTYTAEEIITIYPALAGNKTAQLTYYHQLKDYIGTLDTVEEIDAVTYGQPLTGEYLEHYNEMVAVAAEQMQTVVARITSAMSA